MCVVYIYCVQTFTRRPFIVAGIYFLIFHVFQVLCWNSSHSSKTKEMKQLFMISQIYYSFFHFPVININKQHSCFEFLLVLLWFLVVMIAVGRSLCQCLEFRHINYFFTEWATVNIKLKASILSALFQFSKDKYQNYAYFI